MMDNKLRFGVVAMIVATIACSLSPSNPTVTPSPAVPTDTATPSATDTATPIVTETVTPLPSGSGPCLATTAVGVTTYTRPSLLADVFSTVPLPPDTPITSRSADGWLGFDPGVAQAANIGVFRLRWLPPDAPVTLTGNCAGLPVEPWVPEPGVCYEMVMGPVEVHTAADPASAVSATLNVGDFAAILGRTATGWLFVNGDEANTPGVVGFIPELEMNANGPCDSIPNV